MKLSKSNVVLAAACAALLGATGWLYLRNNTNEKAIAELNTQIDDLSEKERRSVVVQSISRQMEEIAYQQKDISEEQRIEALEQTAIANRMRDQSEIERQNALIAQRSAMAAEQNALEAYSAAESQRQSAESERNKADNARKRAETLRLQSLAVSVANQAVTRYQTGDHELGALLAYTAYDLMKENDGDIRNPDVYRALSMTAGSVLRLNYHKGGMTCYSMNPHQDGVVVTATNYGDIHWQKVLGQQQHKHLFYDNTYDWRDVYYDEGDRIYALSHTGHLLRLVIDGEKRIIPLPAKNYLRIIPQGHYLLLVGDNNLTWFDCRSGQVTDNRKLNFTVSEAGLLKGRPCLFGKNGSMTIIDENGRLQTQKQPFNGVVSTFYHNNKNGLTGYGTTTGDIYLISDDGSQLHLVGHRSKVSDLRIVNNSIYSASYDGTVKMWNLNQARIEPLSIYSTKSWIYVIYVYRHEEFLWAGSADGAMAGVAISPELLAQKLQAGFKRNMTTEEWKAYVGEDVPYRLYKK